MHAGAAFRGWCGAAVWFVRRPGSAGGSSASAGVSGCRPRCGVARCSPRTSCSRNDSRPASAVTRRTVAGTRVGGRERRHEWAATAAAHRGTALLQREGYRGRRRGCEGPSRCSSAGVGGVARRSRPCPREELLRGGGSAHPPSRAGASASAADAERSCLRRPNGSHAKLCGQGPRAEAEAARRLPRMTFGEPSRDLQPPSRWR